MKSLRHAKIKELVERHIVETQEELAESLRRDGIDVTQATVSRDIKELMRFLTHEFRYVGNGSGSLNFFLQPRFPLALPRYLNAHQVMDGQHVVEVVKGFHFGILV